MTLETMSLVALLAFTMTFTPGPANIALVGMASRYGFGKSLGFLAGVISGFFLLGATLALGLGQLIQQYPVWLVIFRWIGMAYLLYLAWKLLMSTALASGQERPPGYLHGIWIHPLNPKAWMMLISAFGQFAQPENSSWGQLMIIVLIFTCVGGFSNTTWCYLGGQMKHWLNTPTRVRSFNGLMASALVVVVLWVGFG